MHNLQKKVLVLAAAVGLSIGMQLANAALVYYTITGNVIVGDAGNAFGLSDGDMITATGIFEDSVLTGGTGTIDFSNSSSSNTMTIYAGTQTLYASNDVDYLSGGGPTISLVSFGVTEVDYLAEVGTNGATVDFSSFLGATNSFDDVSYTMFGDWETTIDITPVPVPAAVWLFGSGLIGLAGVARRKRNSI